MNNHKIQRVKIVDYVSTILKHSVLTNPDNQIFTSALASHFTDLEDAVQYYTALQIKGIDYFITSNIRDFKKASVQLR
ncbi:MAG: hypothetical protein ABJA79_00900 [Parafilimonas sp.]